MESLLSEFKSTLINRYGIESKTIELLVQNLSLEHYKKGDFILKSGQYCNSIKFVVSGIYRVYQLYDDKEITSYFNYVKRNPFIASTESLLRNEASKEYIECIEQGILISIKYIDILKLYRTNLSISNLGRKISEQNYLMSIERIESLQYKNATERYILFMKTYPDLLNKIPHHYIASYIGVTPESLSRIRKSK